jgi:hypothetical protein
MGSYADESVDLVLRNRRIGVLMSVQVVALAGGILFVLVAIVGGGFAIREIVLPKVPRWARAASGVFGILLLLPFMLALLHGGTTGDPPVAAGADILPAGQGTSGIEIDTAPETTSDHIRLTGLSASVRNNPPRVGDTVTVKYSLTNVGAGAAQLEYTFVGARGPEGGHADAEDGNEQRAMQPDETIQADGKVFLDKAGTWTLWPCYVLAGDRFCPDKWKAFSILVE